MSIAGICSLDTQTATANEAVVDVARRMRDRRVGTVIVVDEQRRPMGIVSDRDVAVRVVAAGVDPVRVQVREIMTPMPTMVLFDTTIEAALGQMRMGRMRRLPVVNGLGQLIGIVTLDDILRLLAEELHDVEQLLEVESPQACPKADFAAQAANG
jgi:CBS domain-containing protein